MQNGRWRCNTAWPRGSEVKGDDIAERLLDFAVRVGKVVDALPETRLGRHVAGQLVRCGTASPPNYEEGRAAESRADFVHKLGICLKELRETSCWLRLITKSELLPRTRLTPLCDECEELARIVAKSILTARENRRRPRTERHEPKHIE